MSLFGNNNTFLKFNSNFGNSLSNGNLFNNNNSVSTNNQKLKSIGCYFNGSKDEKDGNIYYGSISITPEFSDLSFEELRLNDYIFAKTGLLPQQPIFLQKLHIFVPPCVLNCYFLFYINIIIYFLLKIK